MRRVSQTWELSQSVNPPGAETHLSPSMRSHHSLYPCAEAILSQNIETRHQATGEGTGETVGHRRRDCSTCRASIQLIRAHRQHKYNSDQSIQLWAQWPTEFVSHADWFFLLPRYLKRQKNRKGDDDNRWVDYENQKYVLTKGSIFWEPQTGSWFTDITYLTRPCLKRSKKEEIPKVESRIRKLDDKIEENRWLGTGWQNRRSEP